VWWGSYFFFGDFLGSVTVVFGFRFSVPVGTYFPLPASRSTRVGFFAAIIPPSGYFFFAGFLGSVTVVLGLRFSVPVGTYLPVPESRSIGDTLGILYGPSFFPVRDFFEVTELPPIYFFSVASR
jgi:hypothetical protein